MVLQADRPFFMHRTVIVHRHVGHAARAQSPSTANPLRASDRTLRPILIVRQLVFQAARPRLPALRIHPLVRFLDFVFDAGIAALQQLPVEMEIERPKRFHCPNMLKTASRTSAFRQPFSSAQQFEGNGLPVISSQPCVVNPSNSSVQPSRRSCSVNWFGAR